MRLNELARSSGVRVSVNFLVIFVVASAIAGLVAYMVIRDELARFHRQQVENQFVLFTDTFRTGGEGELIESVRAHVKSTAEYSDIFQVSDARGNILAGNISVAGRSLTSGEVSAAGLGLDEDYNYFIRSGPIGDNWLVVGTSAEDITEVQEGLILGAIWAALILAAISMAGGAAMALRMNRRIAGIRDALEQVAEGRFDVRIPRQGEGDDIDRLTALIDDAVIRLGAAVEANRQISADIAHDLKTPMNRLRIDVERALANAGAGLPVTDDLIEIDRESRAIIATFDALLRIAQIETGARKARFTSVNVGDVLAEIIDFYEAHAEETGARLTGEITPGLPSIIGDRELLMQLFANLVENSLRHAGQRPRVTCSARVVEGAVEVAIVDNGPGIPEGERENVQRRLYRLEKSRSEPGTGLGLSMVKAIAELHDATLTLQDNKPGLRVVIRFPGSAGRGV